MKIVKGLSIFAFLAIVLGSCFDPPEYGNSPRIDFENIVFVETPNISQPDSLILSLNFRDGDGDLGLSQAATDSPFHEINYFLTGSSKPITTSVRYSDLPPFINPFPGASGKLETIRTKGGQFNCKSFIYDSIYVSEEHKSIFDATYNIYDTLTSNSGNPNVYILLDTFYIEVNPSHYNIEVTFLVKEPGNPNADADGFVVFDWREEFCSTFDGRFPILSEKNAALEGTLKYAMTSTGFKALFSIKTLKLRVKIRDRSLKESNTIDTREFTLLDITRGG